MSLTPGGMQQRPDDASSSIIAGKQSCDYHDQMNWTRRYLHTYYEAPPTIDEIAINKFLLNELNRMQRRFDIYVEGSCEAVITKSIPIGGAMAPGEKVGWADRLMFSDYRTEAIEETAKWAAGAPDAFQWAHYVRMSLQHEGIEPTPEAIAARTKVVQDKVTGVLHCDVFRNPIVNAPLTANSLFGLFFVAGEAGETIEGWEQVIKNVAAWLPTGAHFFSSALRGMPEYQVIDEKGGYQTFKCAELYGDHYRTLLPKLGFANPVVEELEIPNPDVGLSGIIMVSATKTDT